MSKLANNVMLYLVTYMSLCVISSFTFITLVKLGGVPASGSFAVTVKVLFAIIVVVATITVAITKKVEGQAILLWGICFLGNLFLVAGLFLTSNIESIS